MTQQEFEAAYLLGAEMAWCIARKTEDLRKEGKFADCYGEDKSLWQIPVKDAVAMMMVYEEGIVNEDN